MEARNGARTGFALLLLFGVLPALIACRSMPSPTGEGSTPLAGSSSGSSLEATPEAGTWKEYTNPDLAVSLRYPAAWQQTDESHFEGQDGFFSIGAIEDAHYELIPGAHFEQA